LRAGKSFAHACDPGTAPLPLISKRNCPPISARKLHLEIQTAEWANMQFSAARRCRLRITNSRRFGGEGNVDGRFCLELSKRSNAMSTTSMTSVVAVYRTHGQAEAAIDQLWHAGFAKDQVGIMIPGEGLHQATTESEQTEDTAAQGAVSGAVTGTALGTVAGALAMVLIPGLGPVLTGGALMGVVAGAAAGAAAGSLAGPFLAMGFSEEDVHRYQTDLRSGRTVVVVQVDGKQDRAIMILRSHDPVDLHTSDSEPV
jgi:uncharacterized membrane protein